jgi:4-amino-4-deoxy-L-arabinose transferase-like glycosyltransferase
MTPDRIVANAPLRTAVWLAFALACALAYLWGLDGLYIPKFGDEMVYTQIARSTAASGHWLPLQSEYAHMRNTKPPLLFWQALVAGQWGADWRLGALRLPSVLYTWGTALMVGLLAARLWRLRESAPPIRADAPAAAAIDLAAGDARPRPAAQSHAAWVAGAIAAAAFLLFFTTIRYNRTYLTSGPETFWMFGVMAALAWQPARLLASRWTFPLLSGMAIGVACLYKSFVLAAPMGMALLLCHVLAHPPGRRPALRPAMAWSAAWRVAVSVAVGVAMFGLWFALDPDPTGVWKEFVLGENARRIQGAAGYVGTALAERNGVWVILSACFTNAGLLLPLVAGTAVAAWRSMWRDEPVSAQEKVLWLWLLALTLFFLVPSQRTSRYLIPAMPAVAVLIALYWHRMGRAWFVATALLAAAFAATLAVAAWGSIRASGDAALYPPLFWLLPAAALIAAAAAWRRAWSRPASLAAALLAFLTLTGVQAPFNGPAGRFSDTTRQALRGQPVALAFQFHGQEEAYHFILPGAALQPRLAPAPQDEAGVQALLARAPYAIVMRWPGQPVCQQCRIVDARWVPEPRPGAPRMDGLRRPADYWLAREYVVTRP